ncbi:hypothetical protein D3C80_2167060 [compost metagenome]
MKISSVFVESSADSLVSSNNAARELIVSGDVKRFSSTVSIESSAEVVDGVGL